MVKALAATMYSHFFFSHPTVLEKPKHFFVLYFAVSQLRILKT